MKAKIDMNTLCILLGVILIALLLRAATNSGRLWGKGDEYYAAPGTGFKMSAPAPAIPVPSKGPAKPAPLRPAPALIKSTVKPTPLPVPVKPTPAPIQPNIPDMPQVSLTPEEIASLKGIRLPGGL